MRVLRWCKAEKLDLCIRLRGKSWRGCCAAQVYATSCRLRLHGRDLKEGFLIDIYPHSLPYTRGRRSVIGDVK